MQYIFLLLLGAFVAFHITELLWAAIGLIFIVFPIGMVCIYLEVRKSK